MVNTVRVEVTPQLLAANPLLNDEYLFRELARKMVTEMPISELNKLMRFTKIDPNTNEAMAKINDCNTPDHERDRLMLLKSQQVILYEAEVSLPPKERERGIVNTNEPFLEENLKKLNLKKK